jgi:hypothetical protein
MNITVLNTQRCGNSRVRKFCERKFNDQAENETSLPPKAGSVATTQQANDRPGLPNRAIARDDSRILASEFRNQPAELERSDSQQQKIAQIKAFGQRAPARLYSREKRGDAERNDTHQRRILAAAMAPGFPSRAKSEFTALAFNPSGSPKIIRVRSPRAWEKQRAVQVCSTMNEQWSLTL